MSLVTARLRLEPLCMDQADALLALFSHAAVQSYLLDGRPVDADWVEDEVLASAGRFAGGEIGLYAAVPKEPSGPGLVGVAGFRPLFDPSRPELVVAVSPERQRQGFAREMAEAVLEHAARGHHRPVARASADAANVASIRLLEGLGFVPASTGIGPRGRVVHFEHRVSVPL